MRVPLSLNTFMQREKLFFSTIYLILALFASLGTFPLLFVVIPDHTIAAKIGAAIFLALPVVSLALLWRIPFSSSYVLRRWSFLIWGAIHGLLGIGNKALPPSAESAYGNLLILGFVLIAMSFHVRRKELAKIAKQNAS